LYHARNQEVGNCQPKRVADHGEAPFTSAPLPLTLGGTRGGSGRGWHNGIQKGLSCAPPFEGFDYGDVDTGWRDVSSRSTSSGASGGGAGGAMRGVVQLTRAKSVRCAALLGAYLVAVTRLTKQGWWNLTQGLSGRENGTRWGLEMQLTCEYECGSISAAAHPNYTPSYK
jgi:hypothetical protein